MYLCVVFAAVSFNVLTSALPTFDKDMAQEPLTMEDNLKISGPMRTGDLITLLKEIGIPPSDKVDFGDLREYRYKVYFVENKKIKKQCTGIRDKNGKMSQLKCHSSEEGSNDIAAEERPKYVKNENHKRRVRQAPKYVPEQVQKKYSFQPQQLDQTTNGTKEKPVPNDIKPPGGSRNSSVKKHSVSLPPSSDFPQPSDYPDQSNYPQQPMYPQGSYPSYVDDLRGNRRKMGTTFNNKNTNNNILSVSYRHH